MMVDTLTIARELKAADLPAEQAEAIAAAIGKAVVESAATKADVDAVRRDLKAEIDVLRHELKGEIDVLRHEVKAELERMRNQLLVWIMSALVALAGLIVAVVKL